MGSGNVVLRLGAGSPADVHLLEAAVAAAQAVVIAVDMSRRDAMRTTRRAR